MIGSVDRNKPQQEVDRMAEEKKVLQDLGRATENTELDLVAIKAGVESGDLRAVDKKVVYEKKAFKTVTIYEALTGKGMAIYCHGKIVPQTPKPDSGDDTRTPEEKKIGACDLFNYSVDLGERARVRAQVETALEGPEKAIAKTVESLVENAGMEKAEAYAFVIAQRKKTGQSVPAGA
jgi:hypothetical protein